MEGQPAEPRREEKPKQAESVFDDNPDLKNTLAQIEKEFGDGSIMPLGADRTAKITEDRRIAFRIGINLGDIIVEGDDIVGDGVNVAARLQEIAPPGGICISSRVHEDVRDTAFDDGGAQALKNIARPMQIWRWQPGPAVEPKPASCGRKCTSTSHYAAKLSRCHFRFVNRALPSPVPIVKIPQ